MLRRSFLELSMPAAAALVTPVGLAAVSVRLVMIVSPDSPLQDVDFAQLRRLFGGDPVADPSGRGLIPFNHPPRSPDRVGFDRTVLGMNADQVAKYWVDRRIRAQPGPPRTATSLRMLLGVVSKLPGAIGYIRPEYLSSEVRALKVSGKLPETPGYPLVFVE
jgi:ABC-type phosphate transport system substrate-binding protein